MIGHRVLASACQATTATARSDWRGRWNLGLWLPMVDRIQNPELRSRDARQAGWVGGGIDKTSNQASGELQLELVSSSLIAIEIRDFKE